MSSSVSLVPPTAARRPVPPAPTVTDTLLTLSQVQPADRVLVIGRQILDHLISLTRRGCRAVTGLAPDTVSLPTDGADVVWITGLDDSTATLARLLSRVGQARIVAVEWTGSGTDGLRSVLRHLARHGFVSCGNRRTGAAGQVTAFRRRWLRPVPTAADGGPS